MELAGLTSPEVSVGAVSPSGMLGDPAGASAAEGGAVLATLLADLTSSIQNWWGAA